MTPPLRKLRAIAGKRLLNYLLVVLCALQIGWITYAGFYLLLKIPAKAMYSLDIYQDFFAAQQLARHGDIYQNYFSSLPSANALVRANCTYRNFHPPFAALLLVPFSALPARIVMFSWLVLGLIFFGTAMWIIRQKVFPHLSSQAILLGIVLILYSPMFIENLWMGQVSILLVLLVVLAWSAARQGRQGRAGMFLALATFIKLTPAFFLVYLAYKKQWRALGAACCTGALCLLAPLPWLPLTFYWRFFTQLAPFDTVCWASRFGNKSFLGFFSHVFPQYHLGVYDPAPSLLAHVLALLFTAGLLVGCLWLVTRPAPPRIASPVRPDLFDSEWSLILIAMLLVSPITWANGLLFLCLPLVLLRRWLSAEPASRNQGASQVLGVAFSLLFITTSMIRVSPLLLPLLPSLEPLISPTLPPVLWRDLVIDGAEFYALLMLFGLCAWYRVVRLPAFATHASAKEKAHVEVSVTST